MFNEHTVKTEIWQSIMLWIQNVQKLLNVWGGGFLPLLQFDIDGDGSITSEELRHAMIKLLGEHTSKNEIDAVVKEADNNGDGTVDFEGEKQRHKNTHTIKLI